MGYAMANDDFNTTQTIFKTIFKGLLVKLHIDEVLEACLDVVVRFHREIGKVLETACRAIPPLMLLFEGIGHISAITKAHQAKTKFEKGALGIKVMTGITTFGIAIAAFVLPHISIPLILAGTAANVAYSYFNVYKTSIQKRTLEKTLQKIPPQHHEQRMHLLDDINELNNHAVVHREKLKNNMIKTALSTLILVGLIVIFVAPVVALPASIILATATVAYTGYIYKKPILTAIRQFFTSKKTNEATPTPTVESNELTTKEEEFIQPQPLETNQNVDDFLHHEDTILASIATHHPSPEPTITATVKDTPSIHISDAEEEEDGGDGETEESSCEEENELETLRP